MNQNQQQLANKLVVVAGGAGEIGERITRMFMQQGARVLVPSRSKEKLEALGASLKDISTGELIALETDVSTPQGLKTLAATIQKEGVLRAAVSSVGTFWQGPTSLEVPLDEVHRVFEETFFPYVGLTQTLIPALGPDTHFVKLNGILSLQPVPHVSAFAVSATAQMAWTRSLIAEATESTPWITELVIDSLVYKRQSKNRPQNVARAVFCGGVKVVHRRILIPPGVAVQAASVEHRRDVFRGYLWARTASGIGGWAQSTSGGS